MSMLVVLAPEAAPESSSVALKSVSSSEEDEQLAVRCNLGGNEMVFARIQQVAAGNALQLVEVRHVHSVDFEVAGAVVGEEDFAGHIVVQDG